MAIGHVVTRGYGTGTFAGDIDLVPTRGYLAGAAVPTIALSGTATSLTEAQVVAGGGTIVLTLTDDVWVLGTFDAQRQAIIDGLDSDGVELLGWNNEVRDKLPVTAVVRTSATVVTITLDAQAAYDITASETVTVTVPAAALDTYGSEVVAIPTFTISTDVVEGGGGSSKGRPGGSDRRRKKKKPRKEPEKWVDPKRAEIYRKAGTELEPPKVGPKKKVAKAVTEMLAPAVVPIDEGILPESLKPATSATSATSATEARKPEPVAVSGAAVAVPGAAVTEPELDKLDEEGLLLLYALL